MKFLEIPPEVAKAADADHVQNLYRVCRLCYRRVTPATGKTVFPPGERTYERALRFYGFDLKRELGNLSLPKILCGGCMRRLTRFDKNPGEFEAWKQDKRFYVDALQLDYDLVATRSDRCSQEARCRVCDIVHNPKSNELQAKESNFPKKGRPLEQSPPQPICNKCGEPWTFEHDLRHCANVMKRPTRSAAAGRVFAERVKARGFLDDLVKEHLRDTFESGGGSQSSATPLRTGVKLDGHTYLGITPYRYDGTTTTKSLSIESARDLLRLGHLGLGKDGARKLCAILGREGICFPNGGLEECRNEKWTVFGPLFRSEVLDLEIERHQIPNSTPFGLCIDVRALLNVVTDGDADCISRLKFQLDGGRQFLKLSVNVVSIESGCPYVPGPNSVMKNFVIGLGQALETPHNLRQLFEYPSISLLFKSEMPKQVACDLKVAAMVVGIQAASCKYPCPFCLWVKGCACVGERAASRDWQSHDRDFKNGHHNVVCEPCVCWRDSPMEVIALAPLHLLLGVVNKVYKEICQGFGDAFTAKQQDALARYGIRRSSYFHGDLEGNECSRFLDAVSENKIPFGRSRAVLRKVDTMKKFKVVKDKCFGLVRQEGWEKSIDDFANSWVSSGLSWTLKVHIVCCHVKQYLLEYETIPEAGLGLSSEQSGESLHARLQRVWDLRFRVSPENPLFSDRLVDCMVAYNWGLAWDEAGRLRAKSESSSVFDNSKVKVPDEGSDEEPRVKSDEERSSS